MTPDLDAVAAVGAAADSKTKTSRQVDLSKNLASNSLRLDGVKAQRLIKKLNKLLADTDELLLNRCALDTFRGNLGAVIAAIPQVRSLSLAWNDLGNCTEGELITLAKNLPEGLKKLNLLGNSFSSCEKLIIFLRTIGQRLSQLEELDMSYVLGELIVQQKITEEQLISIFKSIPRNVKVLIICHNSLNKSLTGIAHAFPPDLRELDFAGNYLGHLKDEIVLNFFTALKKALPLLEKLGLASNSISSLEEATVTEIFAQLPRKLCKLDISANNLGEINSDTLEKAFQNLPSSLTELNLEENQLYMLGKGSSQVFAALAPERSPDLCWINLSNNSSGNEDCDYDEFSCPRSPLSTANWLPGALLHLRVETLFLGDNPVFHPDFVEDNYYLQLPVKNTQAVTHLNLEACLNYCEGNDQLATFIKKFPNLIQLDLGANDFYSLFVEKFCELAEALSQLQHLTLRYATNVMYFGGFWKTWQQFPNLEVLDLTGLTFLDSVTPQTFFKNLLEFMPPKLTYLDARVHFGELEEWQPGRLSELRGLLIQVKEKISTLKLDKNLEKVIKFTQERDETISHVHGVATATAAFSSRPERRMRPHASVEPPPESQNPFTFSHISRFRQEDSKKHKHPASTASVSSSSFGSLEPIPEEAPQETPLKTSVAAASFLSNGRKLLMQDRHGEDEDQTMRLKGVG